MTEQLKNIFMSEKPKYISVVEQLPRDRAVALAEAANEVGAKVMVLANEGEVYYITLNLT